MLKLIFKQANWSVLGAVFGFFVGFFVKIYLIDIVGLEAWGKYVIAQTFSSFAETILSLGIPFVIIKFVPSFIEHNKDKVSRIANIFIKYSVLVGGSFLVFIYFFSELINKYIYSDISGLKLILIIMCVHVPISMLFGVLISLYRSILKIKEIVLYGTFVSVTLRAVLTFIVFQFTDDIVSFIIIEVFVQMMVLFILLYLFNKNELLLFVPSEYKEIAYDTEIITYGKRMFYNSVVAFISAQALSFIITITLPSEDVGAYNILLSISALTTFLLVNLNKVFAPAISKLYHEGNFSELNRLYQKTTFLINFLTIPLVVIITVFSDEILALYTNEMLEYKKYLFFMLLGGMLSLAAGSSGTLMIMAGLEKQNLLIQIIRAFLLIVLSFLLIPIYGMASVVLLYVLFMLFVNVCQLFYIKSVVNVSPFSYNLVKLFVLTSITMYFALNQNLTFDFMHFILFPIMIYVLYLLFMFRPIKNLIKELR